MSKYDVSPSDFYTDGSKVDQITGRFGEPRANHPHGHRGIDISSRAGDGHTQVHKEFWTPVEGKVKIIEGSEWNTIQVTTPDGYTIQYLHAAHLYRELNGQTVRAWTRLGITGNTGPGIKDIHLHIQVFKNGEPTDPQKFFRGAVKAGPNGQTGSESQRTIGINWGKVASTALGWVVVSVLIAVGYHFSPPAKSEPPQAHTVNLNIPNVPTIPESNIRLSNKESDRLKRFSEEAVKTLQENMRRQDEIEMSEASLQAMKTAIARYERVELAPKAIAVLPPAIRAIAMQPVSVIVATPNYPSETYQQTIGAIATSMPETARDRLEQIITTQQTRIPDDSSNADAPKETHLNINFKVDSGYRQAVQINVTGIWKNQ